MQTRLCRRRTRMSARTRPLWHRSSSTNSDPNQCSFCLTRWPWLRRAGSRRRGGRGRVFGEQRPAKEQHLHLQWGWIQVIVIIIIISTNIVMIIEICTTGWLTGRGRRSSQAGDATSAGAPTGRSGSYLLLYCCICICICAYINICICTCCATNVCAQMEMFSSMQIKLEKMPLLKVWIYIKLSSSLVIS